MKLVTWNCGGAFRNKYAVLESAFSPDLIIVQECEDPEQSTTAYCKWAGSHLWMGESKSRGIGIFDRTGVGLHKLDWDSQGLQSFLSCRVADQFTLVAVWTKYANSPNFRYIGQLWKYLQIHRQAMVAQSPLVLCGDLNSNSCWDERDRWWNHSDVVRELEGLGLDSLYHLNTGEPQGAETQPTLFHQRNLEKPYHVDYAFASRGLLSSDRDSLIIGDATQWLNYSDHMPLAFEIMSR